MDYILPAIVLIATVLGVLILRKRNARIRIGFDLLCLAAFSALLFARNQLPIIQPGGVPVGAHGWWLRAMAMAWWVIGARAAASVTVLVLGHDERSREARLFSDLLAAGIYLGAGLVILNSVLDLPVNGLLATSGVIAIVIGLALQNTLADVFSGIAVGIEQPFGIGDRISVGENVEGIVVQVNWRSIRIQTDGADVATIPNSVVSKAQVINRSVPNERRAASVEITCPSETVPEQVAELLLHALMLTPTIIEQPAPSVSLGRLGMKTNRYDVGYFVESTRTLATAKDILLRQIRRQFHYAGIVNQGAGADSVAMLSRRLTPARMLRGLPLFEALNDAQTTALAAQLKLVTLEAGQPLFVQDSSEAVLYIVAVGVLEISRSASGVLSVLGRIGAGEYIGEISLLTGAARAATATAITRCEIYSLSRAAIEPLIAQTAELAEALDLSVRRGLALLHRDVAARVSQPVEGGGALIDRIKSFFHYQTLRG